jgi:protein-disulfide isomerase
MVDVLCQQEGGKMKKKEKDMLVIILSIAVIIALALVATNLDKLFPPPGEPDPLQYVDSDSTSLSYLGALDTNPDAGVTILEFSDFKCPACAMASQVTEKIVAEYGEQIHFEFKYLAGHAGSLEMSVANECAKAQGKFWEYHHILFAEGADNGDDLIKYAEEVGLDLGSFQSCFADSGVKKKIEDDMTAAISIGIRATPTFVINGEHYVGVLSYERFKQIIEEELSKAE